MSTLLSALEASARSLIDAPAATDTYWSSAEVIDLINRGAHDLWRAINDLRLNHFCTLDTTHVTIAPSTGTLTGIPSDCARVHMLEVADLTSSGAHRTLVLVPKPYNSELFQGARAMDAIDPSVGGTIYWVQRSAGGPVGAPIVDIAPKVTATVQLALTYVPVLGVLAATDPNPIPGESDNALIAWAVAYLRAKERDDRSPDPAWLSIYATEKKNLLVSLDPRQDQEPTIVDAVFEGLW